MAHEVLIGIAQNVVPIGAVAGKIQVLKNADKLVQTMHHLRTAAELGGIVEIGEFRQAVFGSDGFKNFLVELIPKVRTAFKGHHVGKAGAGDVEVGESQDQRPDKGNGGDPFGGLLEA